MNAKNNFASFLHQTYKTKKIGFVLKPLVFIFNIIRFRLLPPKIQVYIWYYRTHGNFPNLKKPQKLNEKINWLKFNERSHLQQICADKYKVREYVSETIGDEYLVPLIFETKNIEDVKPSNFPDFPVIVKPNHDSGGGYIINDKKNENWEGLKRKLKKRLKHNHYHISKEWQYKNMERRIIVEKLLIDNKGNLAVDYKCYCFNGKVIFIHVDIDRLTNLKTNYYLRDWTRAPFYWPTFKDGKLIGFPADFDIEKPALLNKMIVLSEKLAKPFILARVDWYIFENRLYSGEITFHHGGGLDPVFPKEWDYKLGQLLKLPHESQKVEDLKTEAFENTDSLF